MKGYPTTYEEVRDYFTSKNCMLKTTKNNYKNTLTKLDCISQCGHENNISFFHFKKSTFKCRKCCMIKTNKEIYKQSNKTESLAIDFLINNEGIYLRTFEKCSADLLFKPDIKSDKWLPLQIKSRTNINNHFNNTNNYKDMFLILICLETNKIWIIESNTIKCKSIHTKYNNVLSNIYNSHYHYCNEKLYFMIPIDKHTQREYNLFMMKVNLLPFIKFCRPNVEHMVYDYMIEEFKIQDKTAYYRNDSENGIRVTLKKNIGLGKKGPYQPNDFDYLWINLPGKLEKYKFYLIPMTILLEMNIITSNHQPGKTSISLYPGGYIGNYPKRIKTLSLNKYLFDYEKIITLSDLFLSLIDK